MRPESNQPPRDRNPEDAPARALRGENGTTGDRDSGRSGSPRRRSRRPGAGPRERETAPDAPRRSPDRERFRDRAPAEGGGGEPRGESRGEPRGGNGGWSGRGGQGQGQGQGPRRGRRRNENRRPRTEGIRDATASRMAAAQARNQGVRKQQPSRQQRTNGSRYPMVQTPKRKGLEILRLLQQQVSIDPFERFRLETTPDEVSMRVLDLIAPIGRGQRALIVSPPKAGKTTILTQVANALAANHPEVKVYALLVDERPEEVTHFRRSTQATVFAASSDMSTREHISTAEECVNTVVEPVLRGEDVVLLLDSITRLARAYNSVQGNSGRTLSGGLDANTMLAPRQIFGAARKVEHGGSLTILGTALVDTGSRMDEVIFQEFKGTGNTELVLSRDLFEKRIFPCVDISKSGTRKEEKLYPPELVGRLHNLRRLAASYPPDKAMLGILKLMQRHRTNEELLNGLAGLD